MAEQCHEAQQQIANSLAAIVAKVMEKAKDEGSVPHAKFLVEWADLKPVAPKEPAAKPVEKAAPAEGNEEPSLAEILLTTLHEMLEEAKQAKAASPSASLP